VEVVKTHAQSKQGGIAEAASLLEQADEILQGATKVKAISAA